MSNSSMIPYRARSAYKSLDLCVAVTAGEAALAGDAALAAAMFPGDRPQGPLIKGFEGPQLEGVSGNIQ